MSHFRQEIAREGAKKSSEQRSVGLIGHVIRYHPEAHRCDCDEHGLGVEMEDTERHTVDLEVDMGKRRQVLKRVPCLVYSQGIVSNGLIKGDRVWVQFINGDVTYPVVTGFYREPSEWKLMANTFKYAVANVFSFMTGGQ